MSHKSPKIAALIADLQGRDLDAHYLGYFACFNRGQFYEAHDVLEELWLADRRGPNGNFYKGLIQFAGAFVHLQKDCPKYPRLRPAAALFTLAEDNFRAYPRCTSGWTWTTCARSSPTGAGGWSKWTLHATRSRRTTRPS